MPSAGTVVGGRYRLVEATNHGGVAVDWNGVDEQTGRSVAVAVLPVYRPHPWSTEAFLTAARIRAGIDHPGVIPLLDHGMDESAGPYLVMRYELAEPLWHHLIRAGRFSTEDTMAIVAQAADALQAVHDAGLVHGDIRPRTLHLRPDDSVLLTDCGAFRTAMVRNGQLDEMLLYQGPFVTPEQARGEPITPQTDIYALGAVAYQCLSGQRPFQSDSYLEEAIRHVRDRAPALPPDVPLAARTVVKRALAKDPADRWPSAAAMAEAARAVSPAADRAMTADRAVVVFVEALAEIRGRFFADHPELAGVADLVHAIRSARTMPLDGRSARGIAYSVHGAGCRFTDERGRDIDIDLVRDTRTGHDVEAFDAWRVQQFLDSIDVVLPTVDELNRAIEEAGVRGVPTGYGRWYKIEVADGRQGNDDIR